MTDPDDLESWRAAVRPNTKAFFGETLGNPRGDVLHVRTVADAAHEAGVPFSLDRIDELSKKTPNICKVSPSSSYHIEDVARAGGIHAILGEIARGKPGLLDLSCATVTGKTLGENIAEFDVRSPAASQAAQCEWSLRRSETQSSPAAPWYSVSPPA